MNQAKEYTDVFALIISMASFVLALITDRKLKSQQRMLNEQQNIINEISINNNMRDIENAKKADIKIFNYKIPGSRVIVVENIGDASAKNIFIDWREILDPKSAIRINEDGKLPYPILERGGKFEMIAFAFEERPNSNPIIEVSWKDEYSNSNKKEVILSF